MLAIRVTRPCLDLVPFFEKLEERCDKYVIFQHDESLSVKRTHMHGLIVGCQVSTDTLKNWIKAAVGPVMKTDWSFITKDKEGNPVTEKFITYMTKGVLEPAAVKGYSEEEIYNYRTQWVPFEKKKQTTLSQFKVVSEKPETARQRQTDLLQPVVDYFVDHPLEVTGRAVLQHILKVIRQNRIIVGRYKIRDYYDYVMCNLKGHEHDSWAQEIYNLCVKV